MTYVFLGSFAEVIGAGIKLTRFGQRVELPPDVAEQTKRKGGLIAIPAAEFDAIKAVDEADKKRQALEILHNIREGN